MCVLLCIYFKYCTCSFWKWFCRAKCEQGSVAGASNKKNLRCSISDARAEVYSLLARLRQVRRRQKLQLRITHGVEHREYLFTHIWKITCPLRARDAPQRGKLLKKCNAQDNVTNHTIASSEFLVGIFFFLINDCENSTWNTCVRRRWICVSFG